MYMSHDIDVRTGCILGRAPCTKETLLDFQEWCRVTRHPRVFHGLTGCQRTPGNGASHVQLKLWSISRDCYNLGCLMVCVQILGLLGD